MTASVLQGHMWVNPHNMIIETCVILFKTRYGLKFDQITCTIVFKSFYPPGEILTCFPSMHAGVSVGIAVGPDAGVFGFTHTLSIHTLTAAHQRAALVRIRRIGYRCGEEDSVTMATQTRLSGSFVSVSAVAPGKSSLMSQLFLWDGKKADFPLREASPLM